MNHLRYSDVVTAIFFTLSIKSLSFLEPRIFSEHQQLSFRQRIPICKKFVAFIIVHFQLCCLPKLVSLFMESSTSFHVSLKVCIFLIWCYFMFFAVEIPWVVHTCPHCSMFNCISQLMLIIFQRVEVKTVCVDARIQGQLLAGWSASVLKNKEQERS